MRHALLACFTAAIFLLPLAAGAADEKLNVLFIAVDDLRPELGCYGVPFAKTPHIDTLASRSLVFERAYCQYPLCNPSRVSLLTGMRPDTTRVFDLKTSLRESHPDAVTLPQIFRNNGYFVRSIGKIYHGIQGPLGDPESWSVAPGAGRDSAPDPDGLRRKGHGLPWEAPDVTDDKLPDGDVANMAIASLRENASRPFFLAIGMAKPHLPFVAPKKYFDAHQGTSIPLAANQQAPKDAPDFASNNSGELRQYIGMPKQGAIPEQNQQELKAAYLASVAYMDAQVGRIIEELDRLDLRRKTVIILWGDHGYQLGEHGTWTKHTAWEDSARVPLILADPAGAGAGKRTTALVELVDVYPTLTEMCGLTPPTCLEGTSLVPLLRDPAAKWKSAAFTTWRKGAPRSGLMEARSMRTDRFRFILWKPVKGDGTEKPVIELYDHKADPAENVNIAGDTANAHLVVQLTRQLEAGWKAAQPKP